MSEFKCEGTLLEDSRSLLAVRGELDLHTASALKHEMQALREAGTSQLVVDLSGVTFIDSTALGVLVGENNRTPKPLALVTSREVLRVLRVTGLTEVFAVFPSLDEALTAVKASPAIGPPEAEVV